MNLVLLSLAITVSLLPVILIKRYIASNNNNYYLLAFAMICYAILMYSYVNIFRTGIVVNYTLIQLLQVLLITFIGGMFFGESIPILGIVFSCIGIVLLTNVKK